MSKKWYIVHAYSNFEKKVAESIKERAEIENLDNAFDEIIVPTEEVVELRRGRKVNRERRFFPGYVLVNMELTDETFHLVKSTPKVTGFLGSEHGTKPHPVSKEEIDRIINRVEETADDQDHQLFLKLESKFEFLKDLLHLLMVLLKKSTKKNLNLKLLFLFLVVQHR